MVNRSAQVWEGEILKPVPVGGHGAAGVGLTTPKGRGSKLREGCQRPPFLTPSPHQQALEREAGPAVRAAWPGLSLRRMLILGCQERREK